MTEAAWIVAVIVVWFVLGFGIARENERVVKILLGRPYATAESGVYWIPFGIAWARHYTTKLVELTFAQRDDDGDIIEDARGRPVPAGGFITAPGEIGQGTEKRRVGPINIGVTISFRFYWPQNENDLIKCVKLLPNPDDMTALTDIFQEIILDETRSVGCKMTYIDIMSDRKGFAEKIAQSVKDSKASRLLTDTGLEDSAQVVINHIDIPQETLDAIDDEEAERLRAQGVMRKAEGQKQARILEAEGEKQRFVLEGQGRAKAIATLKAQGEEAVEYESLRTLREMAQGTSNTIFFPLEAIQRLFENFLKR